jgi:biopolymer transport protein ExbD
MSEISHRKQIRKRVRPPDPDVDPEFQIAPMIDILLVLLVFFMSISTTEVLQSTAGIDLPVAADAKDAKPNPGQVIVNIAYNAMNNATVITVQDVEFGPVELVQLLQEQVTRNPLVRVLIRADRSVRYEFLRRVLESVGSAGVGNVTFSVVDKEVP